MQKDLIFFGGTGIRKGPRGGGRKFGAQRRLLYLIMPIIV